MNKIMKHFVTFVIAAALAVVAVAPQMTTTYASTKEPELNATEVYLEAGYGFNVATIKLKHTTGDVTWTSSNENVATVTAKANGKAKISAVSGGTCTVKAKYDGATYKCKVYVTGLKTYSLSLKVGDTYKLKFKDNNGSEVISWNAHGTVEYIDETIVKINKNGKVTAKKPGKAIIECTIQRDDGSTAIARCQVTVTK